LVAPPLDGPATGGTLYNLALTDALRRAGVEVCSCTLDELRAGARRASGDRDLVLVDSLYLDHLRDAQQCCPASPVRLLLHYLPSQVRLARAVAPEELSPSEASAIAAAGGFVVTSRYMQEQLSALHVSARRVIRIEPGTPPVERSTREDPRLRALMLANVVPGKGLLPLLQALALQLRESDAFVLEVAGSVAVDPAYASSCRTMVDSDPVLRERVHLLGSLAHDRALARLARSDVLVSASCMESYGMALAEARAAGVPIVGLSGGNAPAHIEASAGGALASDSDELAAELLELARNPALLAERDRLARSATRARSWNAAAAELIAALIAAR
jgi:glycosyltransferase involved in cell wall biosynthesis